MEFEYTVYPHEITGISDIPKITSADPERGQGVRTPLENHKLYGFL